MDEDTAEVLRILQAVQGDALYKLVDVGHFVAAQWEDGEFYPAKVLQVIHKGFPIARYKVEFVGFDKEDSIEVPVSKIRLLSEREKGDLRASVASEGNSKGKKKRKRGGGEGGVSVPVPGPPVRVEDDDEEGPTRYRPGSFLDKLAKGLRAGPAPPAPPPPAPVPLTPAELLKSQQDKAERMLQARKAAMLGTADPAGSSSEACVGPVAASTTSAGDAPSAATASARATSAATASATPADSVSAVVGHSVPEVLRGSLLAPQTTAVVPVTAPAFGGAGGGTWRDRVRAKMNAASGGQ